MTDHLAEASSPTAAPHPIPEEKSLWSTRPSLISLLPSAALALLIVVLFIPRVPEFLEYVIAYSIAVIPWTQRAVDLSFHGLRILLLAPVFHLLYRALDLRMTRYELTSQRLRVCRGILLRRHDEIGLHRIRDFLVRRPLFGLFLGYGSVRILSRDPTLPVLDMCVIPQAHARSESIRRQALQWKKIVGYREFDSGSLS